MTKLSIGEPVRAVLIQTTNSLNTIGPNLRLVAIKKSDKQMPII